MDSKCYHRKHTEVALSAKINFSLKENVHAIGECSHHRSMGEVIPTEAIPAFNISGNILEANIKRRAGWPTCWGCQ